MIDFSLVKFFLFVVYIVHFSRSQETKIAKCVNTPDTWKKVEKSIKECQEDVKLKLIEDAFQSLNGGWDESFVDHDDQYSWDLNAHEQHPPIDYHHSSIHDHHPSIHDHQSSIHGHHSSIRDHHTPIHGLPIDHHHSSTHDHHPSIHEHHPSTHDHHPSTHDHHPSTHDHHPSILEHHPSIHDHHTAIHEHQVPIHDLPIDHHHSSTNDHHSSTHDHHSSTHDHHPSIYDDHPSIHDHHPDQSPQFQPKNVHSSIHHIERHLPLSHVAHQIESPQLSKPQPFAPSTHQDTKSKSHRQMKYVESTDSLSNPVEHHHIDFNDFRKKRDANDHGWIHPSTITYHDKRIAGCIMQCIYKKNHAVDQLGWPTLDGLVNFYSEGVSEHGYFMATLRAVDYCLKGSSAKYHVNRRSTPEKGQTCDVAFDVFDCISDRITEYCSDHHHA